MSETNERVAEKIVERLFTAGNHLSAHDAILAVLNEAFLHVDDEGCCKKCGHEWTQK